MKIDMTSAEWNDMVRNQRTMIQEHINVVTDLNKRLETAQKSMRDTQDKLYNEQSKTSNLNYEIENLKEDLRVQKVHTETAKTQPPDPKLVAKVLQDLLATAFNGDKIEAIKHIRVLTGLDLRGAKDLYENGAEKKKNAA